MIPKKAFLLTAGFGTRFQPQSTFIPKPALPFFNLPQALFPSAALKTAGVHDFYYNAHHLPTELEKTLSPYLKNKAFLESKILLSAGGIANAKASLSTEENFWVANGDSLIFLNDEDVLKEAIDFHFKTESTVTLIGIKQTNPLIGGLSFDKNSKLTKISKDSGSLHFIGLYIFNSSIFDFIQVEPLHIFKHVLLNDFKGKVSVFNAEERIRWHETGNETDFINAHIEESKNLRTLKDSSSLYKALELWGHKPSENLDHFLEHKVWGQKFKPSSTVDDFLCLPNSSTGNFQNLNNSVLGEGLNFESKRAFKNSVLIHSSQWT